MPITSSKIQTLTDSVKQTYIYPRTLSSAVVFESGNLYGGSANETLDTTLNRVVFENTNQTITGQKTFSQDIIGNLQGNASTATLATKATGANLTTVTNNITYYSNTSGTFAAIANNATTTLKFLSQTNSGVPVWTEVPPSLSISNTPASNTNYYVTGVTSTSDTSVRYSTGVYFKNNVLYGAAWNDYAEYRAAANNQQIQPGQVVKENGDGTLSISQNRLEAGCEIVSDTFGFAIGETEMCKLPIAISGRVLAYTDKDRKSFQIGAPVCSGPNGTVSQMTPEEEQKYPSRIIGVVSEIPQYKEWGSNNIKVNNRTWIRVK